MITHLEKQQTDTVRHGRIPCDTGFQADGRVDLYLTWIHNSIRLGLLSTWNLVSAGIGRCRCTVFFFFLVERPRKPIVSIGISRLSFSIPEIQLLPVSRPPYWNMLSLMTSYCRAMIFRKIHQTASFYLVSFRRYLQNSGRAVLYPRLYTRRVNTAASVLLIGEQAVRSVNLLSVV